MTKFSLHKVFLVQMQYPKIFKKNVARTGRYGQMEWLLIVPPVPFAGYQSHIFFINLYRILEK